MSLHIAFDLDGTLIDSFRDLGAAAREVVVGLGGRTITDDEVAMMIGEGARVLVSRALAAGGLDPETPGALDKFFEIYGRRLLDTTVPYAGVEDMLLLASRRARLSVLTNKPLGFSRRILDGLRLTGYFADIIGGDGPHGRKPDPAGLQSLSAGADPAVLVGDSPIDAETARAAGGEFVWAKYGFSAARFDRAPETPYVLERPADFAGVLDRLAAIHSRV